MKKILIIAVVAIVSMVVVVVAVNLILSAADKEECFRVQRMVEEYRAGVAYPNLTVTEEERDACERAGMPVRGI